MKNLFNKAIIFFFFIFSIIIYGQNYRSGCAEFNGTDSYVMVPFGATDPDFGMLSTIITIEAMVYVNSFNNFPTIVGMDWRKYFWFGFNTQGYLRFYPKGSQFAECTQQVPIGVWTHVAVAFDNNYAKFFINGFLVNEVSVPGFIPRNFTDDSLFIGCDRDAGSRNYFFNGKMDYVRIWGREIYPQQMRRDMGACLSVRNPFNTYAGLLASYNFNGNARDYSGVVFNDGLRNNVPIFNTGYDAFGISEFNSCLVLDGNSTVSLPNNAEINATNAITIEAWINKDMSGNQPLFQDIITKSGGASGIDYSLSYLHTSGKIKLEINNPGGSAQINLTSNQVLEGNKWYHIAATYNSATGNANLIIDGYTDASVNASPGPLINNNNYDLYIGGNGCSFPGYEGYKFVGSVDGVRIWNNVERSENQIKENMYSSYDIMGSGVSNIEHMEINFDNWGMYARFSTPSVMGLNGTGDAYIKSDFFASPVTQSPSLFDNANVLYNSFYRQTMKKTIEATSSVLLDSIYYNLNGSVNSIKAFIMLNKQHCRQLKIDLISPAGVTVTLLNNVTGQDQFSSIYTVFDGSAVFAALGAMPPYSPRVIPENSFSAFNGTEVNGWWKLKIENFDTAPADAGVLYTWGIKPEVVSNVDGGEQNPIKFSLQQNYPNPFNPSTTIRYSIPEKSRVRLSIYNGLGELTESLVESEQASGSYEKIWNAAKYSSGIYLLKLEAYSEITRKTFIESKKLVLVK